MKVLHSALMKHASSGILNQMTWEQEAAKQLNLDWDVVLYVQEYNETVPSNIIKQWNGVSSLEWIKFRQDYYKWLFEQSKIYDVLVLRHSLSDPFQVAFLKRINKPVYLVHHTLEVQETLSYGGVKSRIKSILEKYFGKLSVDNVTGIIGVTDEIFNYENLRVKNKFKNNIIYPNGVIYNSVKNDDKRQNEVPELVFIASYFSSWHGLDLLLDELKNTSEKFILHIVGNLNHIDEKKAVKDHRIVLHGHLSHNQMQELMSRMWLGLSSFALFRKNMKEACTLKVREYLKNGLPVYSGHKDIFPESFPYYKFGEPNFEDILNYARKMRHKTREEISNSSRRYIDKEILLKKFYFSLQKS